MPNSLGDSILGLVYWVLEFFPVVPLEPALGALTFPGLLLEGQLEVSWEGAGVVLL